MALSMLVFSLINKLVNTFTWNRSTGGILCYLPAFHWLHTFRSLTLYLLLLSHFCLLQKLAYFANCQWKAQLFWVYLVVCELTCRVAAVAMNTIGWPWCWRGSPSWSWSIYTFLKVFSQGEVSLHVHHLVSSHSVLNGSCC